MNDKTHANALAERLTTEADLCRNEGADDIAKLLDEAAEAITGHAYPRGLTIGQEPKYTVTASAIVNRASGQPIPDDEPVFILRAKDLHARDAMLAYFGKIIRSNGDNKHADAVLARLREFQRFADLNQRLMHHPDTELSAPRRVAPEAAADVDAALGFNELPPIRLPFGTISRLSDQANAAGLVLQAYVRSLLTIASIAPMSKAVHDVLAERQRQITVKGWTPEHDDEHDQGELAGGAAAYAAHASDALHPFSQGDAFRDGTIPDGWCWEPDAWKPGEPYRNLEKAAAMILAEMERMLRLGVSVAREEEPLPHFDEVGSDEFESWFKEVDERDTGLPAPSPRERSRWLGYVARHAIALEAWKESRSPFDDALTVYHHALDTRQHGGVAASNLLDAVESALGKRWVQGATLTSTPAPVEG